MEEQTGEESYLMRPGYDNDINELQYEIRVRMRKTFLDKWVTQAAPFAMSLVSARWDDCIKDIRRGCVALSLAQEIITDAVVYQVITRDYARLLCERSGKDLTIRHGVV